MKKRVHNKWRSSTIFMVLFFVIALCVILDNYTKKRAITSVRMKEKSVTCMHIDSNDMRDIQESLATLLKSVSRVAGEKEERMRILYEQMCGATRGINNSPAPAYILNQSYCYNAQQFRMPETPMASEPVRYKHALVNNVAREHLVKNRIDVHRQTQINALQKLLE